MADNPADNAAVLVGDGAEVDGVEFPTAFPELYRVAYRVAYGLLGDRLLAEDVAQEAMARACVNWRRVRRHPEPRGWVGRVSSRLAMRVGHARRMRAERERRSAGGPVQANVEGSVVDRLDIRSALRRLPRRQREVLLLRYLVDLSEPAVAAMLGLSVGAVKQHASRGLLALRKLRDEEADTCA